LLLSRLHKLRDLLWETLGREFELSTEVLELSLSRSRLKVVCWWLLLLLES